MDINHNDFISRDELESIQLKRLKETAQRVYSLVPKYKKSFDEANIHPSDISSLEDLSKLPFTKKQDLRDSYPFDLFAVPQDRVVRIHSSSGTTGKLTVVGYTEHDLKVWNEVMGRSFMMGGISAKDTIHNAYGYGLFTGGLGVHYGAETIGAAVVPASGGFTSRQLMLMKDFNATVLCCTPSFAMHLYEQAKSEGYDIKKDFKIKWGLFGAEPASIGLKKEIAKCWDITYQEIYGLSEIIGPGVSTSCHHTDSLHIFEDHFLPEIINPKTGETLPYGEQGELVFTTISKQAIPLIRYRTGDLSTLYKEPCECGRTLVRMESIVGRCDDMLIVNGVNVFPSQVEHVLSQVEGLTLNYVIIADKKGFIDKLELKVEVDEDSVSSSDAAALERVKKETQGALLNHLSINTHVIPVPPMSLERSVGKAVRVIDKR